MPPVDRDRPYTGQYVYAACPFCGARHPDSFAWRGEVRPWHANVARPVVGSSRSRKTVRRWRRPSASGGAR